MTKSIQWKTAYLGIGTNKGNREINISNAIKLLSEVKEVKILKVSRMLKNPPQEGIKNGYFLNGAIKILTSLTSFELLKVCKRIEGKLGRRGGEGETGRRGKKRSRIIDLDILFYENKIIDTKEIGRASCRERVYVLV